MKIVFAGTPEFAVLPLQAIIDHGYEVVGVVTQPDKPQGRKGILTPPPVKMLAIEHGYSVLQPHKIKEDIFALEALEGDIMITCAYGQILTQEVLDCFPLGVWNIHAGLLPKYRGASPIQSCILAGEKETGVTVMKTELGLDSGDILCVERTAIGERETCGELSQRLSQIGAELIVQALQKIESGQYTLTPQGNEGVKIFRKIGKETAKIDFALPAQKIVDLVRAMNPAPVAYAELGGNTVNVYEVEKALLNDEESQALATAKFGEILSEKPKRGLLVKCGDGALKLSLVQGAGGKIMSGGDFLNGRKAKKGQVFSC